MSFALRGKLFRKLRGDGGNKQRDMKDHSALDVTQITQINASSMLCAELVH